MCLQDLCAQKNLLTTFMPCAVAQQTGMAPFPSRVGASEVRRKAGCLGWQHNRLTEALHI